MLHDNYQIRSVWQKGRTSANTNISIFLEHFNNFYTKVRMREKPSMNPNLRDPYGWALLCNDYENKFIYDKHYTCQEIWDEKGKEYNISLPTYRGKFSFKRLLDLLYRAYWFDYDKAIEVYNVQHSALSIFKQIMNGNGFVMNRFRPDIKECARYMKHAFESEIALDEDYPISIPYIHRVCDGMVAPFIVMRKPSTLTIEELECDGYGTGLFLTDKNTIVDVLKINDLWLIDLPLENRLKFSWSCKEKETEPYLKSWSWRSTFKCAQLLEANSRDGVLVRGARENFLSNRWFEWNETSLLFCHKIKGELVAKARGRSMPDWYTLNGDEGYINPYEERTKEKVWLDNFDIKEFRRILDVQSV